MPCVLWHTMTAWKCRMVELLSQSVNNQNINTMQKRFYRPSSRKTHQENACKQELTIDFLSISFTAKVKLCCYIHQGCLVILKEPS